MWRLSCGTFTRSTIFCIIPVRSSKKCPGLTGRRSRRGAAQVCRGDGHCAAAYAHFAVSYIC